MARVIIVAEHVEFMPDFKKDNADAEESEKEEFAEETESLITTF